METVPEKEVVRLVDAARLGVVERDEAPADAPDLDGLEDRADRGERALLSVREELEGAFLRVGASLALVCDLVHRRSMIEDALQVEPQGPARLLLRSNC